MEHRFIHWGKVGTLRERLQCFSVLTCKGEIITELATFKPETVGSHGGGKRVREGVRVRERAGIKSFPFREKKKEREREPPKWTINVSKDSSACKMVFF